MGDQPKVAGKVVSTGGSAESGENSPKLPRGIRVNNPFNLKELPGDKTQWQGERASDDDPIFEEFLTMDAGIRAGMKTLQTYYVQHRLRTIRDIITRFAPAMENNLQAYIRSVSLSMKRHPTEFLPWPDCLDELSLAIIKHEQGGLFGITEEQIKRIAKQELGLDTD